MALISIIIIITTTTITITTTTTQQQQPPTTTTINKYQNKQSPHTNVKILFSRTENEERAEGK